MTPKKKVKWAEECLKRAVSLLPTQTHVRMTHRHSDDGGGDCAAEYQYFRADINIDLESMDTKKSIAQYVFHEVMHIPVAPLARVAKHLSPDRFAKKQVTDLHEFVTTSLELMFFKLVFPEFEE